MNIALSVKPPVIRVGARFLVRSGEIVEVTGTREALVFKGPRRERIWYGRFRDGTLCAWNLNGTYRASSGLREHRLDIVGEA